MLDRKNIYTNNHTNSAQSENREKARLSAACELAFRRGRHETRSVADATELILLTAPQMKPFVIRANGNYVVKLEANRP